ncbi:hypothetical protein BD410DRAFT_794226 [Rickenella mellea]|uniref:Uncharacterized protein n=1 Tax=Rickenella mellea TaxID=50990 RepID=A0A4Y7PQ19_9AGAM|nr:hypothetical protein BD410DRAFT_794226 [Rickenella mellea]
MLPFTSASAGQVPAATYTVSPAPAVPDAGAANATVGATDPRIQYSSQWKDSSTCGGSSKSASDAGSQFVFQFKGSAIFMNINLGLTGLVYSADVDGVTDIVDGFRTTQNCGTGWSRFNLDSSLHTVTITILGPSQKAPASSTSQSSLDFSSFTVTSEGSGAAANAGTDTLRSTRRSWVVSLGLSFITAGIMKLAFV